MPYLGDSIVSDLKKYIHVISTIKTPFVLESVVTYLVFAWLKCCSTRCLISLKVQYLY